MRYFALVISGVAIQCKSIDLRVDLSIAKLEIGAVDGLDGRVSEIGVNSLLNRIRSWSKLKRYQLTRGRRLAGERFSSAPPTVCDLGMLLVTEWCNEQNHN